MSYFSAQQMADPTSTAAQQQSIDLMRTTADSLTWGIFVLNALQNTVVIFLIVNIITPLYIDLKARRGDFEYDELDYEAGFENGTQALGE